MLVLGNKQYLIEVYKIKHYQVVKDKQSYFDGNMFEFLVYKDGVLGKHNSHGIGERFGIIMLTVFADNADEDTKQRIIDFLQDDTYEDVEITF